MQKIPKKKDLIQLPSHHLDIWQIDLTKISFPLTLTADETKQAQRFHQPKHQQRFIAARNSLRHILSFYLSINPQAIEFQYNPNGKPRLIASQGNLEFNLSHSESLALVAISHQPVGIDVEFYSNRNYRAVAQYFFSSSERTFLSLPKSVHPFAFFNLWTQKEAFIKANGLGIFHSNAAVDFCYRSVNTRCVYDAFHQTSWKLNSFMPQVACQAAVCYNPCVNDIRYGFLNEFTL